MEMSRDLDILPDGEVIHFTTCWGKKTEMALSTHKLSSLFLVPFEEETIYPLVIQPSKLEDQQFYCRQILIFIIKLNWPSMPTVWGMEYTGIP
jgi:hypothetical protein